MKRIALFAALLALPFVSMNAAVDPNFYIYLCFGQSNMEGNAAAEAVDKTDVGDRFLMLATTDFEEPQRTKGNWYHANVPIVSPMGKLGPTDYFGRTMAENLPSDKKVGVVAVAMGGSPIEMFDKDLYQAKMQEKDSNGGTPWHVTLANWYYGGNPYGRLIEMAKEAQKVGVIKGILLHQGCSNNGQSDWPDKVKKIYEDMLTDLGLQAADVPLFVGETARQDQGGCCYWHNTQVARMPSVVPTSYVISSEGCPCQSDQLHFTPAGYRKLGFRYAQKALSLMGITAEEPEVATSFELDQQLTSLSALSGKQFIIYNEHTGKAFYGSGNQVLAYESLESALQVTNASICFKTEPTGSYYLLRALTPAGEEYSVYGGWAPGYLNGFSTVQDCSFILGLNNQNGQDVENGALWDIQYVSGQGFTLKNLYTQKYLQDALSAKYDSPAYFQFYTIKPKGSTAINERMVEGDGWKVEGDAWYTLDGRKLQGMPTQKGIYIFKGKKVKK